MVLRNFRKHKAHRCSFGRCIKAWLESSHWTVVKNNVPWIRDKRVWDRKRHEWHAAVRFPAYYTSFSSSILECLRPNFFYFERVDDLSQTSDAPKLVLKKYLKCWLESIYLAVLDLCHFSLYTDMPTRLEWKAIVFKIEGDPNVSQEHGFQPYTHHFFPLKQIAYVQVSSLLNILTLCCRYLVYRSHFHTMF